MPEPITEVTLKTLLEEQTDLILRTVKDGFDGVDDRFDAVDKRFAAVDDRFDAVDKRFDAIESDLAHIKNRLAAMEDEIQTLSRTMITKQYLDAKLDIFIQNQQRDSTFKRALLLALEQTNAIDATTRAKLEQLIPS